MARDEHEVSAAALRVPTAATTAATTAAGNEESWPGTYSADDTTKRLERAPLPQPPQQQGSQNALSPGLGAVFRRARSGRFFFSGLSDGAAAEQEEPLLELEPWGAIRRTRSSLGRDALLEASTGPPPKQRWRQ